MLDNKKRLFLYSSILLLILFGVYYTILVESVGLARRVPTQTYVNASFESNESGCTTAETLVSKCGGSYSDLTNWTRGGNTETLIFIINISDVVSGGGISPTANNNVTRINITLPTGFGSSKSQALANAFANASFVGWGIVGGEGGTNWTINTTGTYVTAFNATRANSSNLNLTDLSAAVMGSSSASFNTIYIGFNATARNGTEEVVNWTVVIYNATGGAEPLATIDSGLGLLTGIDGLPPRANGTNATDSINTLTSFSGTKYLRYDQTSPQQGINITLNVNDYNIDRVLLVYNSTGGTLNLTAIRNGIYGNISNFNDNNTIILTDHFGGRVNGFVVERSNNLGKANISTLATRSDVELRTAPGYVFSFNISNVTWGRGATDGTDFRYVFVVYDLYNNSEIINNSNADYVIARDMNNPTTTLTAPSDTSVGVFDPIKYKCDGSDTSGLTSCTTKVTKPGSSTFTKTGCGTEHTFSGDDTNEAGTYTVECTVKDNVARTSSKSFPSSACVS